MCQNNCILKLFDKVVYVCYAFWPREKRYRLEIWYGHSPRSYLKTSFFFCFFKKVTLRAAGLEQLPHHVDILHMFSIALFFFQRDFA